MSQPYTCWVKQAGVATQAGDETPNPVIYLLLTDVNGTFKDSWWYAAEAGKKEMLAVALSAIANQYQVYAFLDPAVAGGDSPHPACYNMYLTAP